MTDALANEPADPSRWWHDLPVATLPWDTDLCHVCGVARYRHNPAIGPPTYCGCVPGSTTGATFHTAGLPSSYIYDRIPNGNLDPNDDYLWTERPPNAPRDCRDGQGIGWWTIPNRYPKS